MHCDEIKHVFNDNGPDVRVNGGEIGNRMAALGKSDPNISKVQNIIGSQKECLRASAVVNPPPPHPFVSRGPGRRCHCSAQRRNWIFFFIPSSLFFSPRGFSSHFGGLTSSPLTGGQT